MVGELTGALAILKKVAELTKKAGDVQLSIQLLELTEKLTDMLAEKAELQLRVRELEGECDGLKRKSFETSNLNFDRNSYWKKSDASGPYCSGCQDEKETLMRMIECANPAYAECPSCKNRVQISPDNDGAVVIDSGFDPYAGI